MRRVCAPSIHLQDGDRVVVWSASLRATIPVVLIEYLIRSADWRHHVLPAPILLGNGHGVGTQTKSLNKTFKT